MINSPLSVVQSIGVLKAAILLMLFGFSVQIQAEYEFVTEFGRSGTSLGQFVAPRGVTVNHEGKIVITESGNHRIQLCDETGSCKGFGGFGELSGEFDRPRDVAVNDFDRIFIADRGNDRIASCSSTGSCTDFGGSGVSVGKFESPRGISIDSLNQIYITDTDNNRVQVCNELGECTAFGGFGSGLGQFNSPAGIAVDSKGRVVVADRGNDRIQICTAGGTDCTAFGALGSEPGQFNGPAGIAIDSQDQIIVSDRFNDRIQVCTHEGICTAFGKFGRGPGQLDAPWGVAVDDQDRIIVADLGNDRIQIFAEPLGTVVEINSFTAIPGTIEAGQSITLNWTVSNATSCVALAGNSVWRLLTPNASGGTTNITIEAAGSYTFMLQCSDSTNTVSANTDVIVTGPSPVLTEMNAGLNDAWYYPVTNGQGFFITVFPDLGFVTLAWFTFDTVRPDAGVSANLGEPGHRWLTAVGEYSGTEAVMGISIASGGLFDTETEITSVDDGTIILTFTDCNSGTIEYDIPSIGRTGVVPIQRVANDNIAQCESMVVQAMTDGSSARQKIDRNNILSSKAPVTHAESALLVEMNAGLNDAWYYPVTNGQGFFITVFPDLGFVTLAWFTFDTVRPDAGVSANLGEPGHRWLTAVGEYSGTEAVMGISIASGGLFDTETEITSVDDGTIILTFTDCNSGTIEYDIPSIGRTGVVPIQRVANDNIVQCEALSE